MLHCLVGNGVVVSNNVSVVDNNDGIGDGAFLIMFVLVVIILVVLINTDGVGRNLFCLFHLTVMFFVLFICIPGERIQRGKFPSPLISTWEDTVFFG